MSEEWVEVSLAEVFAAHNAKLGEYSTEPRVLSLSKYDGFVPADEYFDKRIASKKLDGYKTVDPDDWAYSTIHIDEGSIARNRLGYPGVISPMYTTMRWVSAEHSPEFFELVLRSPAMLARYGDSAQGTVNRRRSLPFKTFSSLSVLAPPLPVQRRIVDLMAHLDNHLANLQTERDAAQALLNVTRRHEFQSVISAAGTHLGTHVKIHHGWAFPSADCRKTQMNGTPRLIRIGDFARSRQSSFDSTRSEDFVGDFPDRFLLSEGDLLIAMTCQTPDGSILGWPMRVPSDGGPYLHNQRIGQVEVLDPQETSIDYLTHLFASDPLNAAIYRTATGTKVLHTSPAKIEEIRVTLPPMGKQKAVAMLLDNLSRLVGTLEDEIRSLGTLRSDCLSSMLGQAIPIPDSYDSLLSEVA